MHLAASDTEPKSIWDKLVEGATGITQAVTSAQQVRDIYKINRERARQGLAPIDPESLAPRVNVGVDRQTMQRLIIPAGVMLGVGLILMMLRKR